MSKWYNYTVECRCCGTSTEDVLSACKPYQKENDKILDLFKAVSLTSKVGKYTQIEEIWGENNNNAFKVFHARAYNAVKAKLNGQFVPKSIFSKLVSDDRLERMKTAGKLRSTFYTNIKEMSNLWNERVIDEAVEGEDGYLVCSHCGSRDVKILDMFRTDHCGVTKEDITEENKVFGFKDSCDGPVYEEYIEFNHNINMDRAEDEFYELAPHYPIGVVCKKLGRKADLIADIIAEYYSVKM